MSEQPRTQVEFTSLFVRFLKHLAKKFRNVHRDLQPFIERLEQGETPGDQVQGTRRLVYKARIRNTDRQRGKSGGYRVIYYLRTVDRVILLAIYSKTEQADISAAEIRQMIEDYEQLSS